MIVNIFTHYLHTLLKPAYSAYYLLKTILIRKEFDIPIITTFMNSNKEYKSTYAQAQHKYLCEQCE